LLWRRKRKAALAPIEQELFDSRSLIILGEELLDSELAVELCRLKASPTLLQDMQKHYGGKGRGDGSRVSVKCLDGLDSAIRAYAWRYAQRHPDREVRLVSDDIGLRLMIEELHRSAGVLGEPVPFNLGARNLWGRHYPEALNMSREQSTSLPQPKTPTPTPKPPNADPKSTTSTARQRPSSAQSSPGTQTPAPSSESSEKTASKKCEEAPTSDVEVKKKKPTQKSTPSSRKASAKS